MIKGFFHIAEFKETKRKNTIRQSYKQTIKQTNKEAKTQKNACKGPRIIQLLSLKFTEYQTTIFWI